LHASGVRDTLKCRHFNVSGRWHLLPGALADASRQGPILAGRPSARPGWVPGCQRPGL